MAQDIRELFKNDEKLQNDEMPKGHEARFLEKLNQELPEKSQSKFTWWRIAASIVVLLGISFGVFKYIDTGVTIENQEPVIATNEKQIKSLGDISPDFRKVEDYYLAAINTELSKMTFSPENKELFDGYIERLDELNKEYKRLSIELTESGPNERSIDALINNLKLRLNLMYRLKEKLNELNNQNESLQENEA